MEQILKDFVRNALIENPNPVDKTTHVVGSDLEQLKHVVGGELTDWKENRPESEEELSEYEWVSTDGQHGIVVNGLPRYIG